MRLSSQDWGQAFSRIVIWSFWSGPWTLGVGGLVRRGLGMCGKYDAISDTLDVKSVIDISFG